MPNSAPHRRAPSTALPIKIVAGLAFLFGLFMFSAGPARADSSAVPAGDYATQCPGDPTPSFSDLQPALAYSTGNVVSPNGHCLKFSVKGGPLTGYAEATSGDPITIYGQGGWKTGVPLQVWASDGLPANTAQRTWPLYLTQNILIGPDKDINRECRTILKGNAANPIEAVATSATNPNAFGPIVFIAPDVTQVTLFNIRASIPNPNCTDIANASSEVQGADGLVVVSPRSATASCSLIAGAPCISVNPEVVYAGQSFQVTGKNWSTTVSTAGTAPQVALYLTPDVTGLRCAVPRGTVAVNQPDTNLVNFTQSVVGPPSPALAASAFKNGVYVYHVYATEDSSCGAATTEQQSATIYVVPPVLNVPTELISQQQSIITGASWLGGSFTNQPEPLQVGLYIDKASSFNCATAKALTTTANADGSFSLPYTALKVDNAVDLTVKAIAYPQGTLPSDACQQVDALVSGTAAATGTSGPVYAVTMPLRIVPIAQVAPPWLVLLTGLLTLLSLLLLLLLLGGNHDEKEVVVTEQDVTVERELVNTSAPTQFAEATFARTIRVTRTVINTRTKKVLDQEVDEYDVFRDAQGREVRRLRPASLSAQQTQKRPAVATS